MQLASARGLLAVEQLAGVQTQAQPIRRRSTRPVPGRRSCRRFGDIWHPDRRRNGRDRLLDTSACGRVPQPRRPVAAGGGEQAPVRAERHTADPVRVAGQGVGQV